jgi:hypothetical protein
LIELERDWRYCCLKEEPGDISRSQFRKRCLNPGKSDWS